MIGVVVKYEHRLADVIKECSLTAEDAYLLIGINNFGYKSAMHAEDFLLSNEGKQYVKHYAYCKEVAVAKADFWKGV